MSQEGACTKVLSFKQVLATVDGETVAMSAHCPNKEIPNRLVGEVNEAPILMNGIKCNALLDTGSMVSTVSESFYKDELKKDVPLHPMALAGSTWFAAHFLYNCRDGRPSLPRLQRKRSTFSVGAFCWECLRLIDGT